MDYAAASLSTARPRTSWAAAVSLVAGVFLCIPVLPGVAAIGFGLLGLHQTRRPEVTGRGLAIAGIVLGIVNFCLCGLAGVGIGLFVQSSEPARQFGRAFAFEVAQGQVDAAVTRVDSSITRSELEALHQHMQSFGALAEVRYHNIASNLDGGGTVWTLGGTARFSSGDRDFEVRIRSKNVPGGGRTFEIEQFDIR
jgi:hypothetical protein